MGKTLVKKKESILTRTVTGKKKKKGNRETINEAGCSNEAMPGIVDQVLCTSP